MFQDYAARNLVTVSPLEGGVPGDAVSGGPAVWLTLLQNHENRTVELLLSFTTEQERGRWVEAVSPAPVSTVPG